MIRHSLLAAAAAISLLGNAAQAATVFFDNFAGETPALTVTSLTNFTVTGNVDVVAASNPFGITTPGGNVIDLDGTTGPGRLTSNSFAFNAGDTVVMSLLLGGAQRGSPGDGAVGQFTFAGLTNISNITGTGLFGPGVPGNFSLLGFFYPVVLPGSTPFTLTTMGFTAVSAGSLKMEIFTNSADNIGPLLASVQLDITPAAVPVPAALGLFGLGLLGLGLARRRG